MAKVVGLVLAAGLSRRMGQFKLLLPWKDDKPLIWHLVERLKPLPLILVTGHHAEEMNALFAAKVIPIVHNPDYAEGEILSSLKTGIRALPKDTDAILVLLGDMPLIKSTTIQQIIGAYQPYKIIVPSYQQVRGHPVLFSKAFFEKILALNSNSQPREVLQAHPNAVQSISVNDEGVLIDIDTPEDYEKYQKDT